ncbi:hypothetical protein [Catenulispora rubra]|uniref:hypothetical protein n=1 Tax=Catenulispora rubra TaxID=280293 RepID=UPI0018926319|nr:hypothetical protein [Catenulispora rubra]
MKQRERSFTRPPIVVPEASHLAYDAGEVVRVVGEDLLFVVVRPTNHRPVCELPDTPELDLCCEPAVLVLPIDSRALRWVRFADVTSANEPGAVPP